MKKLLVFVFFLFLLQSAAQKNVVDSLKKLLETHKNDTTAALICNQLAEQYASIAPDSLLYFSQKSLEIANLQLNKSNPAEKRTFLKLKSSATSNVGFYYELIGQIEKALDYYLLSLKIDQENKFRSGEALVLNNIAVVHYRRGNLVEALDNFIKSLKIKEELKDSSALPVSYNNIGMIYDMQGDVPKALEYYEKTLKMISDEESNLGATALSNMAVIYLKQGDKQKALEYYQKALDIRKKLNLPLRVAESYNHIGHLYTKFDGGTVLGLKKDTALKIALSYFEKSYKIYSDTKNKQGMALLLNNFAFIYQSMGDLDKAFKYYEESLKLNIEIEDKRMTWQALNNLGNLSLSTKQYKKGKEYADRSFQAASELGFPESIREAARLMYHVDSINGDFKSAFKYYKLFHLMSDSTNNLKTQKAAAKTQMRFEYEKKEAVLKAEKEKEKELSEARIKRQKLINYTVAGGMVLVGFFSIIIFNRWRVTKQQKLIIEEQKLIVDEKSHKLTETLQEVRDSITYAKRLQEAILPPVKMVKQNFPESFVYYKPKDIIAGDFYWMERLGNLTFFAAADSTGHGVPGAMVSVVCSNALNRAVKEFGLKEPGKILDKTRELVIETFEKSEGEVKDGMDVSLLAYDSSQNPPIIKWAGANNPLWYISNGELIEIKATKQPIGKTDNPQPFTTHEIPYSKGMLIYLITDGYADQFGGPKGKKFKYKPLQDILLSNINTPLSELEKLLSVTFNDWKGQYDQVDDVTFIGIKI